MSEDLTEAFERIARLTYSEEGPSACVTCKRSVSILPLRYAVIGTPPAGEPTLPVPDLPNMLTPGNLALSTAHYTVRPLREGYLYVFVQRHASDWVCEGAYQTYDSGLCRPLWPADGDGSSYGTPMPNFGERTIQIADPEAVDAARLLFTPDLLTPRMLAEIRSQKRLRDTLRHLDIRQLIQSCHYSEHVLTVEQLESVVADNAAALATALAGQLFPPPSGFPVLDLMVSRLAPDTLSAQGFAVVLDDPIGITQELNAWRNAAAGALDAFMQDTDSEGISNQRKHTIAFALDNLKTTLAEQAEQGYTAHANTLGVRYTDHEYALGNAHMLSASSGRYRSYRNPHDQQQQEQRDIAQARSKSWDDNYADSIDEPRRQTFLAHYQAAVDRADALNNQRAADHLRWLNSAALEDAFACYDRHDSRNGLAFEAQLGVAVSGMNSTPAGDAQLDRWSEADSVSPGNWYWRGLAQNQARALEPINQLLAQRAQLPSLDGGALLALVKPLVEVYDKSHALVGELDFSTPPSNLRLSGAVLLTHTFGTQLLRSGPARLLDGPVNTALALVFRARLGTLGAQLHLETHHAPLTAGGKARMERAAQQSFGNALTAGAAGPMLEVRLGTTLAMLEVMNLMRRAQKHDKGTREYIELMAAIVAVSAAGLELGAVAVGLAERSSNSAVRQAGRVMGSQLKLMAGVLAGGAAFVGMVYDIRDAVAAVGDRKATLAGIYALRATCQLGSAYFSAAIGLAASAPYLERLIQLYGRKRFLIYTHKVSTHLALKMAFMLRWCIRINIVIFVTSVTLELLLPNELQTYLRHSTFRKDRGNGTPKSEEQELENLQKAIEATF